MALQSLYINIIILSYGLQSYSWYMSVKPGTIDAKEQVIALNAILGLKSCVSLLNMSLSICGHHTPQRSCHLLSEQHINANSRQIYHSHMNHILGNPLAAQGQRAAHGAVGPVPRTQVHSLPTGSDAESCERFKPVTEPRQCDSMWQPRQWRPNVSCELNSWRNPQSQPSAMKCPSTRSTVSSSSAFDWQNDRMS